jgi:hypothetical protein
MCRECLVQVEMLDELICSTSRGRDAPSVKSVKDVFVYDGEDNIHFLDIVEATGKFSRSSAVLEEVGRESKEKSYDIAIILLAGFGRSENADTSRNVRRGGMAREINSSNAYIWRK